MLICPDCQATQSGYVDPVACREADDRALSVRALAPALAGAASLARPVQRVYAGDLHIEDPLDSLADLPLVGGRGHDKRVLFEFVLEPVALLRDELPEQAVPVV